MSTHLSTQQLEQYLQHSMPPAELLDAGDHLIVCEVCRTKIADAGKIDVTLSALRKDFQKLARAPREHLTYQQLSAYVDNQLGEADREIVDSHMTVCAPCQEELRDLFAFQETLSISSTAPRAMAEAPKTILEKIGAWRLNRPARRPSWQLAGALAVLVLLILGAWLALRTRRDSQIAELKPTPSPTSYPSPSPLSSPAPSPGETPFVNANDANQSQKPEATPQPSPRTHPIDNPPASAPLLALNDGGGQITLDRQGNLSGLESVSQPERRAVAQALQTGQLDVPMTLSDLRGRNGTLMGAAGGGTSFSVLEPAGTIVSSERPTFRWRALAGASGYTVKVYDTNFNLLDSSPALTATEWTPEHSFADGKVYTWQVTAMKDGSEIISPAPPMPEARFKVLSHAQAEELRQTLAASRNSHLARGVIYTRAGLLSEAEREFETLVQMNPQSSSARKLLSNVRAMRRAK